MNELIQKHDDRANIRRNLLTGASALALIAYVSSAGIGRAEDASQPQVWIELGGQLSRLNDGQEAFAPPLFDSRPSIFSPSQKFERPPLYSIDGTGSISFRPVGSDWTFSAAVRYGRSAVKRHVTQQTTPSVYMKYTSYGSRPLYAHGAKFADTMVQSSERYSVLDFQVGKDVGLGLFGGHASSALNVGIRIAQFTSRSNIALKSDPDWHRNYLQFSGRSVYYGTISHANAASLHAERSFHGMGPSISWSGSAPIAGNPQASELNFDWGLNAALLFGRQRAKVQHQTTAQYHNAKYTNYHLRTTLYQKSKNSDRSRSIAVPNIGAFAGLSFRYADAKVSFGYKADFFFNVIDSGIDTRESENRGFFGPYASVSVGLGN